LFVLVQGLFTLGCVVVVRRATGSSKERPSTEEQREWNVEARRFALPMLGSGLFTWIMGLGDRYLLAAHCTADEVGRYAAVYGLISMPIVAAGGMMARALFPLVFRAAARGDTQAEAKMLRWMFIVASVVGLAAIGGTVVLGPWVLSVVLAPQYREGAEPLLVWLAAGHACLIVSHSIDMKAYARKATLAFTIAAGFSAGVNIICNLIWIPRYRAEGAAMATFVAYLAYLVSIVLVLRRAERWNRPAADSSAKQSPHSPSPSGPPSDGATSPGSAGS
jgi:O-antigen/teichoic acid export membrane protein